MDNPFDTRDPVADGLPLDNDALTEFLKAGPQVVRSKPDLPPMVAAVPDALRSGVKAEVRMPEPEEEMPLPPVFEDGPSDELRAKMVLPTDKEKAFLKHHYGQFGQLKVVPIPFYSKDPDKIQCFVLAPLTRMQWRKSEEKAKTLAESKPVPVDEIFMEDVVMKSIVWPKFDNTSLAEQPAGLIVSLFGIVQNLCLFFEPEKLLSVSFNL